VKAAKPLPAPTVASTATVTASGGQGSEAVVDQLTPRRSNDAGTPYFHWWPKKGTAEWLQFDFKKEEAIRRVGVYWYDDTGTGECRVPKAWRVLYRRGEEWRPVSSPSPGGTAKDRFNEVRFAPVLTTGLRLEVQLQEGWSAGMYEVSVQ
jgi:hypothetical protein